MLLPFFVGVMNSFLFSFRVIGPIILIVGFGYLLKSIGLIHQELIKLTNRLIFQLLLPIMLFTNVCGIDDTTQVGWIYILYSAAIILLIFCIALPLSYFLTSKKECRAPLIQSAYRSNYALIGIYLAVSLCGAEAGGTATILSLISIPLFNILAVITFSVFESSKKKVNIGKILIEIAKNPLIIGIILGVVVILIKNLLLGAGLEAFAYDNFVFQVCYEALQDLAKIATPLALLMLGAQFEFTSTKKWRKEIIAGVLLRTVIAPIIGIGFAVLFFDFEPKEYASMVGLFCTPVAVSIVPMAQEMGSDAEFSGQLVVFTTIFSTISIFVFSVLLKAVGAL